MKETGKISDWFNPLNGNQEFRYKALEKSNKLSELGIDSPDQIERIYKASDFLAFADPTKISNIELFGAEHPDLEQLFILDVPDLSRGSERGYNIFLMVNLSDSGNMKSGDILTIDSTVEGKEKSTTLDPDFEKYLVAKFREANPKFKDLSDADILKGLDVKNWSYEKIVYMVAKGASLEKQLKDLVETPEGRREFFGKINDRERIKKSGFTEEEIDGNEKADETEDAMTVEEASVILGIEEEKLREVAGDDGKILGIKRTGNIEALSRQLGIQLEGTSSDVVLLKVAGPGIKTQGIILNSDGSELYTPEDGDTTLIMELVEDGANGDYIEDIDRAIEERNVESKKIETTDPTTGKKVVEFAEKGNEKAIAGYESESKQITKELAERIRIIKEGPGEESEKLDMIADVIFSAKGRLQDLQIAYNIQEKNSLDALEEQAGDYAAQAEIESAKETAEDVVAGVVTGIGVAMFGRERLSRDEEAMRKRGYDVEGE